LQPTWAIAAGNRLQAQSFKALLNGALDFLLRGLEIVEGCPEEVAESFCDVLITIRRPTNATSLFEQTTHRTARVLATATTLAFSTT
jgi:hypothetical protein